MDIKKTNKINKNLIIGFFDGVHKGHLKILNTYKDAAILTFRDIPSKKNTIYSFEQKIDDLKSLGFKEIYTYDILKNNLDAKDFIKNILIKKGVENIIVGSKFKLGKDQLEIEEIKKYINVIKIDRNSNFSSTNIKKLLLANNLDLVNECLVKKYNITATVIKDKQIARSLGYPTANISTENRTTLSDGVYETTTTYKNNTYQSITFIGKSETINNFNFNIETHIFNFDLEIYGEEINIKFIRRISDVIKFDSTEKLIKQIKKLINTLKSD